MFNNITFHKVLLHFDSNDNKKHILKTMKNCVHKENRIGTLETHKI